MSDGQSTKIILPADLASVASFGTVLGESIKDKSSKK